MPSLERYIELMGKLPELAVFTVGIGIGFVCFLFMLYLAIRGIIELWRDR